MGLTAKDRRFILNSRSFGSARRYSQKYRTKKKILAVTDDMVFLRENADRVLAEFGAAVVGVCGGDVGNGNSNDHHDHGNIASDHDGCSGDGGSAGVSVGNNVVVDDVNDGDANGDNDGDNNDDDVNDGDDSGDNGNGIGKQGRRDGSSDDNAVQAGDNNDDDDDNGGDVGNDDDFL